MSGSLSQELVALQPHINARAIEAFNNHLSSVQADRIMMTMFEILMTADSTQSECVYVGESHVMEM